MYPLSLNIVDTSSLSACCFLIILLILDRRKLRTPTPESTVLHVGCLTRNVNETHLREIFGMFETQPFSLSPLHCLGCCELYTL